MINLSVLDGLLVQILPLKVEKSILHVQDGLTNQLIAEDGIIIVDLDFDRGRTWEPSLEVILFVEARIWTINLVIVSLVDSLFITCNLKERIGVRAIISRCQVISLNHIDTYYLSGALLKHLLQDHVRFKVYQVL